MQDEQSLAEIIAGATVEAVMSGIEAGRGDGVALLLAGLGVGSIAELRNIVGGPGQEPPAHSFLFREVDRNGVHVRVSVFAGRAGFTSRGHCGTLTLRVGEWDDLRAILPAEPTPHRPITVDSALGSASEPLTAGDGSMGPPATPGPDGGSEGE